MAKNENKKVETEVETEAVKETKSSGKLPVEQLDFAKKILSQKPDLDAVYVCDGLFFNDELRAKCYSDSNGLEVFTVKR